MHSHGEDILPVDSRGDHLYCDLGALFQLYIAGDRNLYRSLVNHFSIAIWMIFAAAGSWPNVGTLGGWCRVGAQRLNLRGITGTLRPVNMFYSVSNRLDKTARHDLLSAVSLFSWTQSSSFG
jgi:hypothetical protein